MTTDQETIDALRAEIEDLKFELSEFRRVAESRHVTLTKYRDQNNIMFPALAAASERANEAAREIQAALSQLRQL